jgi:hypothetical protein
MAYTYNASMTELENMAMLAADVTANAASSAANASFAATMEANLDILWLLFGAYLVFFMQVRKNGYSVLFVPPHMFPLLTFPRQNNIPASRSRLLLNRIPLLRLPPQAGFALLEAGSVRAKNTKNILLKNVLDACLGGLIWWTIGYPIALGDMGGDSKDNTVQPFFMDRIEGKSNNTYYAMWMFQWAFAAAAATIVSVSTPPPP